jgi:phage terminase large subunit
VAEFPDALQFLFEPARYKVPWGGRGGAKSWGVGRALLLQGAMSQLRIPCCREFQKSISDSVHELLKGQIAALKLDNFYTVRETYIEGKNGTLFTYHGLRHNIANIKSLEGADRCWVEEAQSVSKRSWEVLIPTIRKDGSEIWVTFNPELATDETYKRFVLSPPPNAIVRKINYTDNPWFPAVLEQERKTLQANDPDAYLNVWEGNPRETLDGAVYANEIRQATQDGRITRVPYDATKPVHTFWDLGWRDATSIWFAQAVGFEYRIIDFLQDNQKKLSHFLGLLQARGYVYGTDWLPHDGDAETLPAAGRSMRQQMTELGRKVRIVPRMKTDAHGINAAREIFPNCWFDEAKCADGLQALRHYRYEVDEITGQFSRRPMHDGNSHAAKAFEQLALSLKEPAKPKPKIVRPTEIAHGSTGWMS